MSMFSQWMRSIANWFQALFMTSERIQYKTITTAPIGNQGSTATAFVSYPEKPAYSSPKTGGVKETATTPKLPTPHQVEQKGTRRRKRTHNKKVSRDPEVNPQVHNTSSATNSASAPMFFSWMSIFNSPAGKNTSAPKASLQNQLILDKESSFASIFNSRHMPSAAKCNRIVTRGY